MNNKLESQNPFGSDVAFASIWVKSIPYFIQQHQFARKFEICSDILSETIWFYHIRKSKSAQIYSIFTDHKGKVMFLQVFVCPQWASWLLVHCWSLLSRGRYASYWNAFLFHRQCAKYLENISKRPFPIEGIFAVCLDTISSAIINLRICTNLSIWTSNPRFNLARWQSTCFK